MNTPAKVCKGCSQLLPLCSFEAHKTNHDRHTGKCKKCLNLQTRARHAADPEKARAADRRWREKNKDRSRQYMRTWVAKNQEKARAYLRDYQRKKQAEIVAARPALQPCHCGNADADQFRWQKGRWICRKCVRASFRHRHNERDRARNRILGIDRKSASLLSRFGPKVQSAYLRFIELHPQSPANIEIQKFIKFAFPSDYQNLRSCAIERILLLNKITLQPIHNIGWNCAHCQTRAVDHRFFDIDHATARSLGGSNSFKNFQVLCPNCHRLKTISDLHRQRKAGAAACAQGDAKSTLTDGQSPPVKITLTGEPEHSGQNGCLFPDHRVNGNRATSVTA